MADRLPPEALLEVFSFLVSDGEDLLRAEGVNRDWNVVANDPTLWESAFKRTYPTEYRWECNGRTEAL